MPSPVFSYCAMPEQPEVVLPPGLGVPRERAILAGRTKWVNDTTLRYYFFDSPAEWAVPDKQAGVIRQAFDQWAALGIGLRFKETKDATEAEIRIGFQSGDGSWSYVGRDILQAAANDRTMNFGWDLAADAYGLTTALHEIGHTMGLPHEHQNPFAGIVWDEEKVYEFLGKPPNNWPRQTTFHNVLRKLKANEVAGSTWDPKSIMQYSFPPGLIKQPIEYNKTGIDPPGTLSDVDKEYVLKWYPPVGPVAPPVLAPFQSQPVNLSPGGQADFTLEPPATRDYKIGTFGDSDVVMVVFEEVDGELRQLTADDDSGEDRNALIETKLFHGRRYVVRVRLYYAWNSGGTAVMYW
jgi:hypothetical protein